MRYMVNELVDGDWVCREEIATYEEALKLMNELKARLMQRGIPSEVVERTLRITMGPSNPAGTRSRIDAPRENNFPAPPQRPSLLERLRFLAWLIGLFFITLFALTIVAFVLPNSWTSTRHADDMDWARSE